MPQHYKTNKIAAQNAYKYTKEAYPHHVEAAHQRVVDYLKRYDKRRLLLFLGDTADPKNEAYFIHTAFHMIASMLSEKDKGNPNVTPHNLDYFTRLYLQLPYPVIQGGKA